MFLFSFRNICFTSLHIIERKSYFLAISFSMRVITSIGEASMLPSAIAVGKENSLKFESDLDKRS